jgi:hypothetical protein
MEFLIGALVTLIVYITTFRIAKKEMPDNQKVTISYSQSHIYELMRPYLEFDHYVRPPKPSQSLSYVNNAYVKMMFVKDKAYWIKNNKFYTAKVSGGEVQKETAKEVDTMSMSKVELEEMIFIVEKLREEGHDYRGPGK